jgi:putative tryptophan/tyrosine transport system substrate-binding protein
MTAIPLLLTVALGLLTAPLATPAQPPAHLPRLGILSPGSAAEAADPWLGVLPFRQGLRDLGYVEGQTIRLEYRFGEWQWERLPALARDLVQLAPDVIFTQTTRGALAAQQATTTIPIVIGAMGDPVASGVAASLARPGGNLTGRQLSGAELEGKRLELLKAVVPTIARVAMLVNPANPAYAQYPWAFEAEMRALGVQVERMEVGSPEALEGAFAAMVDRQVQALSIVGDALFDRLRHRLMELAITHHLPTVAGHQRYAEAGGLLTYGPNIPAMHRRAAVYVDKILKGAKPGELPIERPLKFDLVINLRTAQALGLTIPPTLLFQADEVLR